MTHSIFSYLNVQVSRKPEKKALPTSIGRYKIGCTGLRQVVMTVLVLPITGKGCQFYYLTAFSCKYLLDNTLI
ncbi:MULTISPECIES: hypothetical protein [Parabacteroides]|uniref:hypothetical protein n=1 Tax=Parabacteroides leei TaxID=2939491 RepID=UPI0018984FDC|nr:hypothetical protein [Parabacteroides goldsteinii]